MPLVIGWRERAPNVVHHELCTRDSRQCRGRLVQVGKQQRAAAWKHGGTCDAFSGVVEGDNQFGRAAGIGADPKDPDPFSTNTRSSPLQLSFPSTAASQIVSTGPPLAATFCSRPPAPNAIHRPSGENAGRDIRRTGRSGSLRTRQIDGQRAAIDSCRRSIYRPVRRSRRRNSGNLSSGRQAGWE